MLRLVLVLALLAPAPAALAREMFALVVGVSSYPSLDERFRLAGPANDAVLVRDYLTGAAPVPFPEGNVLVLADGVEGAGEPTLAGIRAAFGELAARAGPGDFVYLHFSGHGTQAPARDAATETDGLDELFLPIDIGPWNDTVGAVSNALVDDEIGALIDTLRARGADVWAVFDACYSGTVTRAAPGPDDVRKRMLGPEALGIPAAAMADVGAARALAPAEAPLDEAPAPAAADGAAKGALVAFSAAQSNETTEEKLMPRSTKERVHGVFTYTLFETLASRPDLTYRQLGQEVLRRYAVKNLTLTTPLFEGDLDRVVFGAGDSAAVAQWPAEVRRGRMRINAGSLHGLVPGSELAVMASAADPDGDAIAAAVVTRARAFSADVELADGGDIAALPRGVYLRRVSDQVDLTITVARPERNGPVAARTLEALRLLEADRLLGPRVNFAEPGDPEADIRLAAIPGSPRPDAVWLLPPSGTVEPGQWGQIPSVSTSDKTPAALADTLAEMLAHIAKAQNVMKIGAALSSTAIDVPVEVFAAEYDYDEGAEIPGTRAVVPAATVPRVHAEDVLALRVKNTTEVPLDLNVLYVGSDYAIVWVPHANLRLQPGDVFDDVIVGISAESFGRDQLVVILSPAEPQSPVEDLRFLALSPLQMTRAVATREVAASDFGQLLGEAGFGSGTRAAVALGGRKRAKPMVLQFPVEAVPGG